MDWNHILQTRKQNRSIKLKYEGNKSIYSFVCINIQSIIMSITELRKRLIDKINLIENDQLLREASRLFDLEIIDIEKPYILSEDMENAVSEAQTQVINGNFLTNSEANKEIEKWFEG